MKTLPAGFLQGRQTYIASADASGVPHVALATVVTAATGSRVVVSGWFCPQTLANLETNPAVALVVRATGQEEEGYQLVGAVEEKGVAAMLDGFTATEEPGIPQQQFWLSVRVTRIMAMSDKPHSDRDLV